MRLLYRARQFWLALGAQPDPDGLEQASSLLTPALMEVFRQMQPEEQAHALNVFRKLLKQGEKHPDLLAAALLHDCGKQLNPLNPLERVWVVLAQKLFPSRLKYWGKAELDALNGLPAWRRPLVVAVQHPLWGAEMAEGAGGSPMLQALIRRHQGHIDGSSISLENELLRKLQVVDNES